MVQPLLVMTRPEEAARAFVARLEALRGPVDWLHAPAFALAATGEQVPGGAAIFTSANGVAFAPEGGGQTAWCVGEATAAAATARGWRSVSADGDAEALVALILSRRPAGPLWHLAGADRRGDVAPRLAAAGLKAGTVTLYRQVPLAPSDALRRAFADTRPLVAPVFSPRSVAGLWAGTRRAPLAIAAISPAVAEAARALAPDRILTAAHPDADHMRTATETLLRAADPVA